MVQKAKGWISDLMILMCSSSLRETLGGFRLKIGLSLEVEVRDVGPWGLEAHGAQA